MGYLALDMGSTWTKAAYLSKGEVVEERRLPTPLPLSTADDRYEIDAAQYFDQALSLLRALNRPGTEGVLLSTQMHGCVLTDEAFQPLTPYISWRDGLGRKHLPEITRLLGPEAVSPSGVPLKANLALCALMGRLIEGEQLPQGALFCTLGGYVIGRLTHRYVCHMTNAAPSGLADVRRGCWNDALIRKAGLAGLRFPRLSVGMEPVGEWQGIPVYADWGDQQVCAAGAKLTEESTLHVSVGTAGLIGALSRQWAAGPWENRPWLRAGVYLRTVSGLPGGRHMAGLEKLLRAAIGEISGETPAPEAVWNYLKQETHPSAPGSMWDILAKPADQMLGAFYASFGEAYAAAAARLALPLAQAAFSGGAAAQNAVLCQAICHALQCDAIPGEHDVWMGMLRIMEEIKAET